MKNRIQTPDEIRVSLTQREYHRILENNRIDTSHERKFRLRFFSDTAHRIESRAYLFSISEDTTIYASSGTQRGKAICRNL